MKNQLYRQKKVKGEAHINHKGRVIEAKKVGPDCKCKRYKCFSVITDKIKGTDIEGVLCNSNKKPPGQSLSRFGLSRTYTCTMCDMLRQKIEANKNEQEGKKLAAEKELHLRKAEAFYSLKRKWKQEAHTNKATVISFDFMQNLNESVGRKGQNDVTSHLFHFLRHKEITSAETLVIFSDGCAGQNQNYTMDFSIINKRKEKVTVETPQELDDIMVTCRLKPSPFDVINVDQSNLFDVKKAVEPYFLKTPKPPLKLKILRMYKISIEDPNIVLIRESYSGP
ncbi:hypothetical protein NQ314_006751 [Rhamnusium bicolor]|uniref:Uncharacterized protein n=1 Tax=Rhamnusium bicolor TaxID=1586634 RepID=A0AAV8YZC0_9CUCU|nr:hypothetical protein NQ314_006751 [Rhamnusium bicolor]